MRSSPNEITWRQLKRRHHNALATLIGRIQQRLLMQWTPIPCKRMEELRAIDAGPEWEHRYHKGALYLVRRKDENE